MGTDLASLVLAIDSTQVKTGTVALDGLTAAGTRAEAATVGLGSGFKGAGVQAAAMATAAQASARAAMDQAAGFRASASAAQMNTLAMRESLVVARELARGNITRIPGSLTLLAQGIGSGGGFGNFASALAQNLGLIKQVQNAELAEAAASTAAAAAGVEGAVQRAGANVMAANTELALAEAAVRVAESGTAEAAAQARVAAALEAVAAAAAEATIAENALAAAQGRAAEAGAASAAATRTSLGATSVVLLPVIAALGLGYAAAKRFQEQVKGSGELDQFAEHLRLTDSQIRKMGGSIDYLSNKTKEISGITVSLGDIMAGVWKSIGQGAAQGGGGAQGWATFKNLASEAFSGILQAWNVASAGISAGLMYVFDRATIVWKNFPAVFADVFYQAVNLAISALNDLVKHGVNLLNDFIGFADKIPGVHVGNVGTPQIGLVNNPYAGANTKARAAIAAAPSLSQEYQKELALNNSFWASVEKNAIQHRKDIMQKLSDANRPPKPPHEKKVSDHGLAEAIAKLKVDIQGQYDLAAAYLVSDAAAQRAIALQKAEEDAIAHKSKAGVFYELELQKAVATDAAEAAKHVADLNFEAQAREKVNAMIAAGLLPASQANQALQMETELRKLNADLENADAKHKGQILALIQATIAAQSNLNRQIERENALKEIAANDNEAEKLRLENSLIGVSNQERAVTLAQLEAIQKLRDMPDLGVQGSKDFIQSYVAKATAGVATPFQEWAKDIPQTADAITRALQGIEFKGFDTLASSIAGVIDGTKSLGQVFSDISQQIVGDLVQMIVKMLLFRALSSIFGGGFNTGSFNADVVSNSANMGVAMPLVSALGNVFSRGSLVAFASGGIVGGPTLFPMNGGQTGLMGEAGQEAIMPLARDSSGRLGVRAANNNQSGPIEVRVVIEPNEKLDAHVVQISGAVVRAATPIIVKAAVGGVAKAQGRPKLMGPNR